jgi:hypothetical protein
VGEELSERLGQLLASTPERFKFLNMIFVLDTCIPQLIGVIDLPFDRKAVERHIQESPGKDHSEASFFEFVKLNANEPRTEKLLSRKDHRWALSGICALISSIEYSRNK